MANDMLLPRPRAAVHPSADGWAEPDRRRHTLVDPRDGKAWGCFPMADAEDVSRALNVATAAVPRDWTAAERTARIAMLDRLIEVVEQRHSDLAGSIIRELGSPPDFASDKHVGTAINHLRAIRTAAQAAADDLAPDPAAPQHRIRYEPLGVALLITPWNWPLNQVALKVGAALVAGCTMVLKPSELATPTALVFAECMAEAGVPPEVFSVVLGDGQTGAALAALPEVDVISFTGSTRVGRSIAITAAQTFTRTNLELGGKSPNLLFDDCELPLAVEQGLAHAFRNAGQSCNAASRMLVQAGIYDTVVEHTAVLANRTKPLPLVSQAQFDRVQEHIEDAISDGARLVAGGPGAAADNKGFTPRPTVFADVTPDMRLARQEVFGPVLAIGRFDTEAEAIALANDCDYALAAYVQTSDPARADRVARQLNAGMVQVNGSSRAPGAPFGGRKASGWGREAGLWGIRAFQDIKSVSGARQI